MRGRTLIPLIALGAGFALLPDAAGAQLSPQGVLGGITRPFRQVLGHFRHFPRGHHRRTAIELRASAPAPQTTAPANAGSRLGWVGPPAWPTSYEDLVGFTFWPDDYASRVSRPRVRCDRRYYHRALRWAAASADGKDGDRCQKRCRQRSVRRILWRYFERGQQLADHPHRTDISAIRHPTCLA